MAAIRQWTRLLAYGGLNFPLSTVGLPLAIYLAPFYAGEIGLPLAAVGTAMLIARLFNFAIDPLIGIATDRWRPKMGRRKVWVPLGTVTLAAGVWLLFNPPHGIGLTWFVMTLMLTYLGFVMTQLPYHAWGSELSSDYDERTRITTVREFFSLGGLLFATLIPAIILARKGATSADVLHAMSVAMIAGLALFGALLFFFVPDTAQHRPHVATDWRRTARQLWRNGPYMRLVAILLFAFAAETFRITITLFFSRDVVGVQNFGIIYVLYFGTGLLALPFWRWLGGRIGKHRALLAAFAVVVVTNLLLYFVGQGQAALFTAMYMLKGSCFGALELLPSAMAADTADVDTVMSKQRRQGLLFAIYGMIVALGQAVGQGLSLNLLEVIGFKAAGGNDAATIASFKLLYCLVPTALMIVPMWILWRYPLTAARHGKFQRYVETRTLAPLATP